MKIKWIIVCLFWLAVAGIFAAEPKDVSDCGLLYYAKADFAAADNRAVINNPYIIGALFQVVWSEVEKQDGQYDWTELDGWTKPWLDAGKKVAIRIMWSTSGYWPKPYYKTPTPQWVWHKGAVFAFHKESGTEIPLIWDPVYREYAERFLTEFAARYDGTPNLLFVDVTPGAETNPYRFGTISQRTPEFQAEFTKIKASDGRTYTEELWIGTVKGWIDTAHRIFQKTPLLVTLNVGGLGTEDHSVEIGDYCAAKGLYVGQNGLSGQSFLRTDSGRSAAFVRWAKQTKLFFEMAQKSGGNTGTLMEVMRAAERIGADYVNVYPEDVLRGTTGQRNSDPDAAAALKYGHEMFNRKGTDL